MLPAASPGGFSSNFLMMIMVMMIMISSMMKIAMMMTTLMIPCRPSVCSQRAGRWRGWNSSHIQVGIVVEDADSSLASVRMRMSMEHEHDDAGDDDSRSRKGYRGMMMSLRRI